MPTTPKSTHRQGALRRGILALAAVLGLVVVAPGCVSVSARGFVRHGRGASGSLPAAATYERLVRERSRVGRNDCSNKCGRYVRALRAAGQSAEVLVVSPRGGRDLHAIVKLSDGRLVDPTHNVVSRDLTDFGELKFVLRGNPESWGAEFM